MEIDTTLFRVHCLRSNRFPDFENVSSTTDFYHYCLRKYPPPISFTLVMQPSHLIHCHSQSGYTSSYMNKKGRIYFMFNCPFKQWYCIFCPDKVHGPFIHSNKKKGVLFFFSQKKFMRHSFRIWWAHLNCRIVRLIVCLSVL